LVQLAYFAERRPEEARAALAESGHPVRFYPFAVAGINLTQFVCELLGDRALDFYLY
ncbi:unnamed protein product, partial [Phaeothamnion confervicola]